MCTKKLQQYATFAETTTQRTDIHIVTTATFAETFAEVLPKTKREGGRYRPLS